MQQQSGSACLNFIGTIVGRRGIWALGAAWCVALACLRRRRSSLHTTAKGFRFRLRQANACDSDVIMSMIRGLAEFEKQPHAVVLTSDRLRNDLEEGYFECVLAEEPSGVSVGFALYYNKYSTATGRGIFLHDLYVVPGARRSGLGLELLRSVAEAAHARGCAELHWIAFDWNENAVAFYKSPVVGAHETGTTVCRAVSPSTSVAESECHRFVNFVMPSERIASFVASG